jgi:hypothetical protein
LLSNDLIIVRNHRHDEEDERDLMRALERQGDAHIKVEIQSNLEFQSLILSPTQSLGPPQLQIDVHDTYDIGFESSTYARKEDEIELLKQFQYPESNSSRSGLMTNIKTDAHVTYDIQLGRSWTLWKIKEITFPME